MWTLVPGHLSSHSALLSYGLFVPLALWQLSVSLRPLVEALGSCPASGAPWSSTMPPSLGRGRVINNNMGFFVEKAPHDEIIYDPFKVLYANASFTKGCLQRNKQPNFNYPAHEILP